MKVSGKERTVSGAGWNGVARGQSMLNALVGLRLDLCNDMGICPQPPLITPFPSPSPLPPEKTTCKPQGSVAGSARAVEARSSLLMTQSPRWTH